MSTATFTSRDFNQDLAAAKRAAAEGPVFITDRGRVAHVLLSAEEYKCLLQNQGNIADLLAMPSEDDVDFEPSKVTAPLAKPEEF